MAIFETVHFGEMLRFEHPPECDMVLICVNTKSGHQPIGICLPHQVYRDGLQKILAEHPDAESITLMPYQNCHKWQIPRHEVVSKFNY